MEAIEREHRKAGGPAFPNPALADENYAPQFDESGMTLRDYFAAQIVAAIALDAMHKGVPANLVCENAYMLADAMIEERAKT